jgi:hypothetical protein
MGYLSEKQLEADYLEIVRKSREREHLRNQTAKDQLTVPWTALGLVAIVVLWYLAAHYIGS